MSGFFAFLGMFASVVVFFVGLVTLVSFVIGREPTPATDWDVAKRLADAAGDGAFDHEDDTERWQADEEDRAYWLKLARAAATPEGER